MAENPADKFQSMATALAGIGMPLRQIARESQLSPATIHRAVSGDSRMPSHRAYSQLESVWEKHGKPKM